MEDQENQEGITDQDEDLMTTKTGKTKKGKNVTCKQCGKILSTPFNLNSHIKTVHEHIRNYKCVDCGKTFSNSSNLRIHVSAVHKREKNHKCHLCDKSFSQLCSVKAHISNIQYPMRVFLKGAIIRSYFQKSMK